MDNFFRFDKRLVYNQVWRKLPYASRQVFPVIGIHCNKNGECFPSQETIARLAGLTPKTCRVGIEGLLDTYCSGFSRKNLITRRGKKSYCYQIKLPPMGTKDTYFINRKWFDHGHYSRLTHAAKSLWLAMAAFSYYDCKDFDFEDFKDREFDVCDAEPDVLTSFAGISMDSLQSALESLRANHFVYSKETPHFLLRCPPQRLQEKLPTK